MDFSKINIVAIISDTVTKSSQPCIKISCHNSFPLNSYLPYKAFQLHSEQSEIPGNMIAEYADRHPYFYNKILVLFHPCRRMFFHNKGIVRILRMA